MKLLRVVLCLAIVSMFVPVDFAFSAPQDVESLRDGSSIEAAIIIKYAGDYEKSINQEYEYLDSEFGVNGRDWQMTNQALLAQKERYYDQLIIQLLPSGEEKTLYFDITEPYNVLMKQFE